MILFILLLVLVLFFPYGFRYLDQHLIRLKCEKNGYVVLTYDDGPSSDMTQMLLDALECSQTKATFFLLGKKVERNVFIAKRIASLGHEIGCHGYEHINAWKTTPWRAIRDIDKGVAALSRIGLDCKLFRPPYGKINIFTWGDVALNKMRFAWWTAVSDDTAKELPCPYEFTEKLIARGGGVVLMHDFHQSAPRIEFVLKVTSLLIEKAKTHGLQITTLGNVLPSEFRKSTRKH